MFSLPVFQVSALCSKFQQQLPSKTGKSLGGLQVPQKNKFHEADLITIPEDVLNKIRQGQE